MRGSGKTEGVFLRLRKIDIPQAGVRVASGPVEQWEDRMTPGRNGYIVCPRK